MSYGTPRDTLEKRHHAACIAYLRACFDRAPDHVIWSLAEQVFKYSPTWVLRSETIH